jgi:hypothetical protein
MMTFSIAFRDFAALLGLPSLVKCCEGSFVPVVMTMEPTVQLSRRQHLFCYKENTMAERTEGYNGHI